MLILDIILIVLLLILVFNLRKLRREIVKVFEKFLSEELEDETETKE